MVTKIWHLFGRFSRFNVDFATISGTQHKSRTWYGILYCRLRSFSQPILQIPALVIVMLQQGLIWRVQVSPQRKLNFLLNCISIPIIILLIKIDWQTFYHVFPRKQLQSPLMFSKMSCQWLLHFKNTAVLSLNNCTAGQKHCVCLISCCMDLQYVCTMHTINEIVQWCLEKMQMSSIVMRCEANH